MIREEGWTKAGMDKMEKMDSFIRETQRLDGIGARPLDSLLITEVRVTDSLSASRQSP